MNLKSGNVNNKINHSNIETNNQGLNKGLNKNIKNKKNNISVIIGNVKYNLSATESESYIRGIASYINNKLEEIHNEYRTMSKYSATILTLLSINIADDLFKQRQLFTKASQDLEDANISLQKATQALLDKSAPSKPISNINTIIDIDKISNIEQLQELEQELHIAIEEDIEFVQEDIDIIELDGLEIEDLDYDDENNNLKQELSQAYEQIASLTKNVERLELLNIEKDIKILDLEDVIKNFQK